ncbi:MAG: GDP-mannose 4,6-dehydratase [Euryarchaeota archaeon]|nr:GDP-mannose 4,6-dehydratase [Euryarchaeota archaeon]MBU4140185.1 GDP-mannose 4,6-dehydratase [Euryarchaeota archaeon]
MKNKDFWQNKFVLLTGATGFVGPYLVKELLDRKARIKVLTMDKARNLTGLEDEITLVRGNITDTGSLQDIMKDADMVFHLAAVSNVNYAIAHPRETFEINATGTLNLLEEARKNTSGKFVYISSSHVYGVPQYLPMDEKHPVSPRELYSASKASAEMLVNAYALNYGLKAAIIRPFNMFGPGQSEDFIIPSIIKQAYQKDTIELGNLSPTRDMLYIKDAINGMLTIAEHGDGIYNLGSGRETSIKEVVESVIDIIDPAKKYVSIESRRRSNAVDIPRMCADVSKLKMLGWLPEVDLRDGLMKMIKS